MVHEKAEVCNLVNCPFNGIKRMYKKIKKTTENALNENAPTGRMSRMKISHEEPANAI
jgi:hypothetical protein